MKNITSFVLSLAIALMSLALPGCAGRQANVVNIYQPGDEGRSCVGIESEMTVSEEEILRLIPQADKTAKNWILGTAGFFLLVPYFFMDLSKAEQQEINALRHRYNYLLEIAKNNGCQTDRTPLPDFSDKATMKAFYESEKKLFPDKK